MKPFPPLPNLGTPTHVWQTYHHCGCISARFYRERSDLPKLCHLHNGHVTMRVFEFHPEATPPWGFDKIVV